VDLDHTQSERLTDTKVRQHINTNGRLYNHT